MLVSTTETITNASSIEILGMVTGSAVKARHIGSDFLASLKKIVGGEIPQYTQLMNDTRDLALDRMKETARAQGANAVIGVRFVTSEVMEGIMELCAYGTAVRYQ